MLTSGPAVAVPAIRWPLPRWPSVARLRSQADSCLSTRRRSRGHRRCRVGDAGRWRPPDRHAGQTKRDEAQRAKEALEKVGARVVGVALVNVAADAELRKYLATG